MREEQIIPVGARILVRDAEWRVLATDAVREGGYRLKCVGLSELVRGKQTIFLTMFEDDITILKPEETILIQDCSGGFEKSKLYLEALIRTAPLTDDSKICVAHHAAMDPLPYQFNPTLQALSQPRARILIADAVGIGKTLEAGILVSELIARGRGKRILVVATKSVLPQFQREFWNRFSIPLTRLDSTGIQRVRNRIPTNHNPFHYFDKAIISIDTLKRDLEYRYYLENAHWDIIVIDEAHNVAERSSNSQRANLAKLLADRSDTMIMLSATPHDGRSESFASLLNILDATAIVNPHDYKPEDFAKKGLVIRRFKHHIRDQIKKEFPDRKVEMRPIPASKEENAVYDYLSTLTFKTLDQKKATGAQLFSTTLTKAMFSSPKACISVIEHRLAKLRKKPQDAKEDIAKLEKLLTLIKKIKTNDFSKFCDLVEALSDGEKSIHWTRKSEDRLVIFTESVKTMEFLGEELPKQLKLKAEQCKTLSGAMKDTEIATVVNEFNNGQSPMRLLICSDVASEGLNLHHFAHRMIHFDIPWSLLVFQQRNGRIDRYGQEKQPQIFYLQTMAENGKSQGDARVLQRLQEKDYCAQSNLDDPAEFLLTQEEQEDRTAAEMEGHLDPIEKSDRDFLARFFNGDEQETSGQRSQLAPVLSSGEYKAALTERGMIFNSDMEFGTQALDWLKKENDWERGVYKQEDPHRFFLRPPEDLCARMKYLPSEVLPKNPTGEVRFDLTDDTKAIQEEMRYVLSTGQEWPSKQLFWALHPVMKWIEDRLQNIFGRHSAPVLPLKSLVDERWVLLQGGFPNRRGYIPVHRWIAVREKGGKYSIHTLKEMVDILELKKKLTNPVAALDTEQFGSLVRNAVACATKCMAEAKDEFEKRTIPKLEKQRDDLNLLREKHIKQMQQDFGGLLKPLRAKREEAKRKSIEDNFRSAESYIEETATLQKEPYLQLVAVFCPANR